MRTKFALIGFVVLLLAVACDREETLTPPSEPTWMEIAAVPNASGIPPRQYWIDRSAEAMWQYVIQTDTTLTVGIKAPRKRRGYWHGERLVPNSIWEHAVETVMSARSAEVTDLGTELPVMRIKVQSVKAIKFMKHLPFID